MTTRRLVFLHGFTQTHFHWRRAAHRIATELAEPHALAYVDLPGHGLADADRGGSIDDSGDALTAVAGPGTYIGYSMGGRMALVAAASDRLGTIERIVLIGATAGLADEAERADRCAADDRLADRVESIGVDAFLDEWLAGPLFAHLPTDPDGLERRRTNSAAGLAHSLRRYGTGRMAPLWDRLGDIDVPVLVLAGERDTKFTALGQRLATDLPRADLAVVPGAGHAAHTEDPAAVARLIADWTG